VGRIHSRIRRSARGIFIKDQGSKNGTYVDGHRLEKGKSKRLELGHKITLGGAVYGPKVCLLEFSLARPEPGPTETRAAQNKT
jgi:pSer/pThr/pTyr-binding forkhead associated (FHA) protein